MIPEKARLISVLRNKPQVFNRWRRTFGVAAVDLWGANLEGANMRWANLEGANMRVADLDGADLEGANLEGANMRWANMRVADLDGADLEGADLEGANLEGATGLLDASEWLRRTFKATDDGLIVYKRFGVYYFRPKRWVIEPGSVITEEHIDTDRRVACGAGINFATMDWLENDEKGKGSPIWRCLLAEEDIPDAVVPYATDGKARCRRLKLLGVVTESDG